MNCAPLISILFRLTPASILLYMPLYSYNFLLCLGLLLGLIITAFVLSMMAIFKESGFVEIDQRLNKTETQELIGNIEQLIAR